MDSRIFHGWVKHSRFAPKKRRFQYKLSMMLLKLDEALPMLFKQHPLFSLEKFNFVSFKAKDHYKGETVSLQESVAAQIKQQYDENFSGDIFLLTHCRYLNYQFNPLSIYYCYPKNSDQLQYIVLEVTNTPWNEQHHYLMKIEEQKQIYQFEFEKTHHVSPFLSMNYQYELIINNPCRESLIVHLKNKCEDKTDFSATMKLEPMPFNRKTMTKTLCRFPLMTFKVIGLIYWQALKIWLSGIKYQPHPKRS